LVVVFDSEAKALEGKKALLLLDDEGSVTVYAYSVVAKGADGKASIKDGDDSGPLGTLATTALGTLIGALFGPVGMAVGATAGFAGGATADLTNAGIGEDFIDDVSKDLHPSSVALVAEVEEDWTTPVDVRMEAIGGTVFRRALSDVGEQVHHENVAAMKADLAQFKAELAQAHADRKAKLQQKINALDTKIQAHLQAAKEKREAAEAKVQAKAKILKAKASAAVAAKR